MPTQYVVVGGAVAVTGVALAMMFGSPQTSAEAQPPVAIASIGGPAAEVPAGTAPAPQPAPTFAGMDDSREGIAAYNNGDMSAAVEQFTSAVENDPNNAAALNNLGQVLVRTGRAREAIQYFDRAIAIADGVWSYHFNRARAYGELKEWRQAIAGYTDAARLFPDDYATQFNLARALQADGNLTGAIEAYGRAAELAPGQPDFHLWYGQALEQTGRTRDAAVEYRRFLELDPNASQAEKVKARLTALGEPLTASS
jgi:tetratricopeptide (TPR) repeat protein